MVAITLRKFPSSYANFIETLTITNTDKDLMLVWLSTKLLWQDRWRKQFGDNNRIEPSEVVLAEKFKSKGNKQTKRIMEIKNQVKLENPLNALLWQVIGITTEFLGSNCGMKNVKI